MLGLGLEVVLKELDFLLFAEFFLEEILDDILLDVDLVLKRVY